MTDTAVENAAPESTEAPVQTFTDQLQELQFNSLQRMIAERNGLVGKANAVNGDVQSITEQVRENSDVPEIVEAREQLSKWVLKLDELVKPEVEKIMANRGEGGEDLEKDIKEKDSAIKPGINYYKHMYGEKAAEFFTKLTRLTGVTVRAAGSGRRIRGYNVTVEADDKTTMFENFSSAAKFLGLDTGDLQQGFFNKAGEDSSKFPKEVSYSINYETTDAEGTKTTASATVTATKAEAVDSAPTESTAMADEADEATTDSVDPEADLSDAL